MKTIDDAWQEALAEVDVEEIGPTAASYLKLAKPLGNIDGTILLAVPYQMNKRIIEQRASEQITASLAKALGRPVRIAVSVDETLITASIDTNDMSVDPVSLDDHPQSIPQKPDLVLTTSPPTDDLHIDTHLNPKYIFDSFIIGPSNRFAHAAARAVSEGPAKSYNPLFIYGDSGLGKTHLLHAIGHEALSMYPHLRIRYVNSEEFTNDFINCIREDRAQEFQQRYRKIDILLIDDIQFIQGKEQTMEEFFHTFNTLYNANKQVVITSDLAPKELSGFEERLRSRFTWGLITDVQPPDLETRIAILQNKARADNLEVSPDVLEYIASRISSNIRELEGCLLRVTAFANLTRQHIDLSLAEMVLKDIISDPQDTEVTAALIIGQTAHYFGLTIDQLSSHDRSRPVVIARQIAMYLCRELTDLSLPKIGEALGGRDHTTVMHANKQITKGMAEKPEIFNHVTELTNRVKQKAREQ